MSDSKPPPFQPPTPWPGGLVTPSATPPDSPSDTPPGAAPPAGPSPAVPRPPAPSRPLPPAGGAGATPEPNLSFSLDGWLAELGGVFRGTAVYKPSVGESGRATGIRVRLVYDAYGAGGTLHQVAAELRWAMEPGSAFVTTFEVGVPGTEPVSYDGQLITIRWQLEVAATRPWRSDHTVVADVLVVPVGGLSVYRSPHPYRPAPG